MRSDNNHHIGQAGLDLIKSFEGCKLEAYLCPAGVWTIGYGHTHGVVKGQKITQDQADQLLIDDLDIFVKGVDQATNVPLSQNEFDALVSFAFNVGIGAFKSSTMCRLINEGKLKEAADQFDRWNKAGGKVLAGLTRRRKAEKELFLKDGQEGPKEDRTWDLAKQARDVAKES